MNNLINRCNLKRESDRAAHFHFIPAYQSGCTVAYICIGMYREKIMIGASIEYFTSAIASMHSGNLLIGSSIKIAVDSYRAVARLIILRVVSPTRPANVGPLEISAESSN